MKRLFLSFLAVLVLITGIMITPAFADEDETDEDKETGTHLFINDEIIATLNDGTDEIEKPTFLERAGANIVMIVPQMWYQLFGASDITFLVFQRSDIAGSMIEEEFNEMIPGRDGSHQAGFGSRSEYAYGVFAPDYFGVLQNIYNTIASVLYVPIVLLLTFYGVKLYFSRLNSERMNDLKKTMFGLMIFFVGVQFAPILFEITFAINYFIIDLMYIIGLENDVVITSFLYSIWGNSDIFAIQSLGLAFLVFLAFFMTFVLNYQYALRMIMLSVLFITFPIVLLSMISPVRREAMTIWMHEFISNVFMQAAHAFTLVLFFIIRDQMGVGNLSFWVLAACLFALPVVATLFQRFIGAFSGVPTGSNSVMGNMGAMFGVAAVANMGRMLGQMSGKGGGGRGRVSSPTPSYGPAPTPSVSPRTSGGLQQVPTGSGLAQAMDAKSSSRWPSGKAVMGGLGTMAAQRGKQIGRGAAIGAGIATGGTVSAMMTGNPAIGGAVGALAGNKAANNAGSMADRAKRATELMKQYDQSGMMEEGLYEGAEGQGGIPSVNALDQAQDAGKLPQSSDDKFQNSLTNGEKSAQDLLNGVDGNRFPMAHGFASQNLAMAQKSTDLASQLHQNQSQKPSASDSVKQLGEASQNHQAAQKALSSIDRNVDPKAWAAANQTAQNAQAVLGKSMNQLQDLHPALNSDQGQALMNDYLSAQQAGDPERMNAIAGEIDEFVNHGGTSEAGSSLATPTGLMESANEGVSLAQDYAQQVSPGDAHYGDAQTSVSLAHTNTELADGVQDQVRNQSYNTPQTALAHHVRASDHAQAATAHASRIPDSDHHGRKVASNVANTATQLHTNTGNHLSSRFQSLNEPAIQDTRTKYEQAVRSNDTPGMNTYGKELEQFDQTYRSQKQATDYAPRASRHVGDTHSGNKLE